MKYKTKIINDFVLLKKQAEKIQIKIDSLNVWCYVPFGVTKHRTINLQ